MAIQHLFDTPTGTLVKYSVCVCVFFLCIKLVSRRRCVRRFFMCENKSTYHRQRQVQRPRRRHVLCPHTTQRPISSSLPFHTFLFPLQCEDRLRSATLTCGVRQAHKSQIGVDCPCGLVLQDAYVSGGWLCEHGAGLKGLDADVWPREQVRLHCWRAKIFR